MDRLKALLFIKGYTQVIGIEFDKTFGPVIKPTTIQLVLALVISSKWLIKQLDIQNAFLHSQVKINCQHGSATQLYESKSTWPCLLASQALILTQTNLKCLVWVFIISIFRSWIYNLQSWFSLFIFYANNIMICFWFMLMM